MEEEADAATLHASTLALARRKAAAGFIKLTRPDSLSPTAWRSSSGWNASSPLAQLCAVSCLLGKHLEGRFNFFNLGPRGGPISFHQCLEIQHSTASLWHPALPLRATAIPGLLPEKTLQYPLGQPKSSRMHMNVYNANVPLLKEKFLAGFSWKEDPATFATTKCHRALRD